MRFCDNTIKEGDVKIRIVHGNLLRLAIRLTRRTLEKVGDEIEATDEDFIPSSDYPVTVELSKGKEKLTFNATMREGSLACIEDKGTIPVGTYCVTVRCKDEHGNPYRFKQRTVVRVYDVTADAGITTPVEYEVGTWYLDAAIFLALSGEDGNDGVGIDDIITDESEENGGYNTVTFVLSDGSTRWFRVRNGSFDIDTALSPTSMKPLANATITARFKELDAELNSLFAGAEYNSNAKRINFFGRDKTLIAWIDATPFLKYNELTNAYISNGQLIIVTSARTFSIPLSSVFNPNNYYTRTQVDNRIASTLANYYTKSAIQSLLVGRAGINGDDNEDFSALAYFVCGNGKSEGPIVEITGTVDHNTERATLAFIDKYNYDGKLQYEFPEDTVTRHIATEEYVQEYVNEHGGSGGGGYSVAFDDGNVIFSGAIQPTYNNGNIIF